MIKNIGKQEFAARIGIGNTKFQELYNAGYIPKGRSIGRHHFWLEAVVDYWIIKAFDYPMQPPELSPALMEEVDNAVAKMKMEKVG